MLTIQIDRDACRGAGECLFRAPQTFDLDDAGKAVAKQPPADPPEAIEAAARSCPNFAIRVDR